MKKITLGIISVGIIGSFGLGYSLNTSSTKEVKYHINPKAKEYLGDCFDEYISYKVLYTKQIENQEDRTANLSRLCRIAMKNSIPKEMQPIGNAYTDQHLLVRIYEEAIDKATR